MAQLDVIIIGQGLAGSLLGIELLKRGKKILVVDDGHQTSSTKIAAGMMNPITGQRLVSQWTTEADREAVYAFYASLEKTLGVSFMNTLRVVRFLSKQGELSAYEKKRQRADYKPYIKTLRDMTEFSKVCDIGKKQFVSENVCQINTPVLLRAAKQYFLANDAYLCASFEYKDLHIASDGVSWQGYHADYAIFCEGARGSSNPFFMSLEFENALGHIVEISCEGIPKNTILNHGKWLCPMGDGRYKYGATSYWEASEVLKKQSKEELLLALSNFLKVPFHIKQVVHGVRPVLKERRPFSGLHPRYRSIGMINGLGGQGMSLAPIAVSELMTKITSLKEHNRRETVSLK